MAKQESSNTINMHGGIYINNIEHIEHFHAPTDNSTDNSTNPTQVNNTLVAQKSLINDLLPVFFNKEEAVRQFLQEIQGREERGIVKLVKELVGRGVIAEEMSHKNLYDILTRHKLYRFTLSNWNKQL